MDVTQDTTGTDQRALVPIHTSTKTASALCAGIGVLAGSRSLGPREEASRSSAPCRVDGPYVNVLAFSPPAILRGANV